MSFTSTGLSLRIADWIRGTNRPEHGEVLLDRKRVYILPTTAGAVFAAAMMVLLIGSINYSLQLGFMLTFLVSSMAIVGMHQTHRNLARVTVRAQSADNVYAGDHVSYEFTLTNPTAEARHALQLSLLLPMRRRAEKRAKVAMPSAWADVPANGMATVRVGMGTRRRGRRHCPRVRIATRFPFGLFQAWSYVMPALAAVIYPTPEQDPPPLPTAAGGNLTGLGVVSCGDDFAGVRPYVPGDQLKMVAWRLAARTDELSVKLFEATGGGDLVLDFDQLPAQLDVEAKLSRLTAWINAAETQQLRYGLHLPDASIELGGGAEHRARCLTALALFKG
ncbi:MAG: DUF58 domain-containing protein [Burkholderiales bacterium]|nr:DUF58 domain-containing protein [Burkholderiales bacterium]